METPISDFVERYVGSNPVRLHMPGHKGADDISRYDITEVKGTDDLISLSEQNASEIFGCPTYYSAEGSSLCIRAMLSLLLRRTGKRTVIAARNCHRTFITACALLDLDVIWLPEDGGLLSSSVDISVLDDILGREDPCCVYITSPDYLGNLSDIQSIASVCHDHGCLLAVDNAHGAYLKFFDLHPMDLGADICCDSAHKTLPVLTGGAYLHVSFDLNGNDVRREMDLFASTSPSWLILASLDRCNKYMSDPSLRSDLHELSFILEKVTSGSPIDTCGSEPLKITFCPNSFGYTGDELADILRSFNIEPEFSDENYVTLMFSRENRKEDIDILQSALRSVEKKDPIDAEILKVPSPEKVIGIRAAVFARTEVINVDDAVGRVAGFVKTSCPPAVPIVIAGERIGHSHVKALKKYGFKTIEVCCDIE